MSPRSRLAAVLAAAAVVAASLAGLVSPSAAGAFGPPAPPAPTCGGTTLYKPDGTKWVCTFDDEFNGNTLDPTKWTVQQTATSGFTTGPLGSQACYVNSRNNVYVSGGYLYLVARKEAAPFRCATFTTQYTAGTVSTIGKFSQTYGRFDVRAKFPATTVAGLQETLWLWPNNDTLYGAEPTSGEIDFAETYSQVSNLLIPYIHYTEAAYDPNVTSRTCQIGSLTAFHDYTLVWTPTTLTIAIDGTTCVTDTWDAAAPLTNGAPFNQPFFLVLTQALGIGTNAFVPGTTPLPATTMIDYARIWK